MGLNYDFELVRGNCGADDSAWVDVGGCRGTFDLPYQFESSTAALSLRLALVFSRLYELVS